MTLHWKGLYYHSIENCTVIQSSADIVIRSLITGKHDTTQFQVEYQIRTTPVWEVSSFEMLYQLNGVRHAIKALRNNSNWIINDEVREEFNDCLDIDITLTPLTNTLPINRLNLKLNQSQIINVLYVDVLNNDIRVARQRYCRTSSTTYNFQNVPNDFEGDIIVDANGFVEHYPELFERQPS